jgi:hypothetical protein
MIYSSELEIKISSLRELLLFFFFRSLFLGACFFEELSSKGIEPLTVFNQFFYREPPLPIGSPALYYMLYLLNCILLSYLIIRKQD